MNKHLFFIVAIIMAVGYYPTFARDKIKGKEKIKILILSGNNNHAWQETTPFLENMLRESGIFEVKITNRPDTLNYQDLRLFDAVISNWNSFPDNDLVWPRETEDGLLRFLKEGGGVLFFHASTSALYKWPEFKKISTGAWVENTWHGPPGQVEVVIENQKHPITKGLRDFETFDELWFNAELNKDFQVLGSALNDTVLSGELEKQPAISVFNFGKGRIFHTILGHDVRAMKNIGFQTLILRGAEWVATAKVTQKLPVQMSIAD